MKWIAIVASIQQQQQQHWSEEFVCWFSINLSLSLVLFKAIPPLLGVIYLLFLHLRLLRLFASIPNRALRVVHSLPHFIHSRAVIIIRKFHWIISQAMTLNFHWLHLCCCSRTKKVMMMNMRYSSCAFFRVWVVFFLSTSFSRLMSFVDTVCSVYHSKIMVYQTTTPTKGGKRQNSRNFQHQTVISIGYNDHF